MRALLLASSLLVAAHARADVPDWSVRVTPFDQIYPALELSQAPHDAGANTFGGGSGLIAVRVRAQHAQERLRLRVEADELNAPTELDAQLPLAGAEYELRPPLRWNRDALVHLTTPRTTTLRFALARDGTPAGSIERAVTLRPLSEALYFVRDGADSVDLSWIFAAYVDEDDATAARVEALALQSGIVDKFDGYADADAAQVYREVWAVWQALAARGIRYSDADPGIARGPHEFSQRVRLLDQTWADRTANCIDGSVLITSVLQRIGLRSFLVLVPGHAFVGFYTDADARHAAYLETTLLGAPPPSVRALPAFAAPFDPGDASRAGIDSFAAALASGAARHARVAIRLDGRHRPDYAVIDIAAARAYGIRPIALRAGAGDAGAP